MHRQYLGGVQTQVCTPRHSPRLPGSCGIQYSIHATKKWQHKGGSARVPQRLQRVDVSGWKRERITPRAGLDFTSALPVTDGWNLWALLAIAASLAQILQSTRVGALLSGPLLAILMGLLLSFAGILPPACPAYDIVSTYLLPLAAALYLLESDLRELGSTARDTVVAFILASIGTILGTLVAWRGVGALLGLEGSKIAAALAASYIGGSVNFAAVSSALNVSSSNLIASAMSADILAMAGYLAIISSWPVDDTSSEDGQLDVANVQDAPGVSVNSLGLSLAAASLACAAGNTLAAWAGTPGFSLGLVAVAASCLASAGAAIHGGRGGGKAANASPFTGSEALGGALMSFFFVTIGAAAGSFSAVLQTGWLPAFIGLQLGVHLAFTVGVGKLLKLPLQAILTASNAAVGGPGTAAAMATSRNWRGMIRPALVVGAFGYSIGTPIGIFLSGLLT